MLRDIPIWFKVLFVFTFIIGVASAIYAFKECGTKAFLLGDKAVIAAAMGMCE